MQRLFALILSYALSHPFNSLNFAIIKNNINQLEMQAHHTHYIHKLCDCMCLVLVFFNVIQEFTLFNVQPKSATCAVMALPRPIIAGHRR